MAPKRLGVWSLVVLLALASLMPSVSALAQSQQTAAVPVCSASGTRWVMLDSAHEQSQPQSTWHGCVWCILGSATGLPATGALDVRAAQSDQAFFGDRRLAAPAGTVGWPDFIARAPPAL